MDPPSGSKISGLKTSGTHTSGTMRRTRSCDGSSHVGDTPVEAVFRVWTRETDTHTGHPDQERKVFNGEVYWEWYHDETVLLPLRLARTWMDSDIDELIEELQKLCDVGAHELANQLTHTRSKDTVLELVSTHPEYQYVGKITDVRDTRAFNGSQKIIDKWCTHEVFENFQGSLEKQYKPLTCEISNACAVNAIMNAVSPQWNAFYKKEKSKLTPDRICAIAGKKADEGWVWEDVCKVLEELGQFGDLYGNAGACLESFEPTKENRHVRGKLIVVYRDGHYQWVPEADLKRSITQCDRSDPGLRASSKYPKVPEDRVFGMCHSVDESAEKALAAEAKSVTYLWKNDLSTVLHTLLSFKNPVVPKISLTNIRTLRSITYPLGQRTVTLRTFDVPKNLTLTSDEALQMWHKEHELKRIILDKSERAGLMSRYHPEVYERLVLPNLRCHPPSGLLREYPKGATVVGLDQKLCFTHKLYSANCFPVFSPFDTFRKMEPAEPIQPYNLYFTGFETRYGLALCGETPTQVCVPHRLIATNPLRYAIKNFLNDESIHEGVRKSVCNKVIGHMGKARNTNLQTEYFKNEMEAARRCEEIRQLCPPEMTFEGARMFTWQGLWVVQRFAVENLSEGFLAIHKLIYDMVHVDMFTKRKELEAMGINPVAVKVDCFFVSPEDASKLDWASTYKTNVDNLGLWKRENPDKLKLTKPVKVRERILRWAEPRPVTKKHAVSDEWNSKEINALLGTGGDWILTSRYPGSGKTYSAIKYAKDSGKTFVVATYSNSQAKKLRKKYGKDVAFTLYKIAGARVTDDVESKGLGGFDIVIVDELLMHGSIGFRILKAYKERNHSTQFIATGDPRQNKPIEQNWNGHPAWYHEAVASMFPNELPLRVMKRYKDDEIQVILDLERKIWEESAPFQSLGHLVTDWKARWTPDTMCVAYTNDTRNFVNNAVHFEILGHTERFVPGIKYVARLLMPVKDSDLDIHPQEELVLKGFDNEYITLLDDDSELRVPRFTSKNVDRLSATFWALPYVYTGHSVQGDTRDGPVMIFDTKCACVDANWMWVAVTRSTIPSQNIIVDHEPERMYRKQIENKIDSHKTQDLRAGRDLGPRSEWLDANYVKELSKKQGHCCFICGNIMNFVNLKGHPEDWSLDRIDNSLSLLKGNCKLSHVRCNTSRHDIYV